MSEIAELKQVLYNKAPFQKQKIEEAFEHLDEDLLTFLQQYIHLCAQEGISIDDIAEGYVFLLRETMKEQMYFIKYRTYRYNKYRDVSVKVYNNAQYMKKYMIGLALSTVMWKNHVQIYKFFKKFIHGLPGGEKRYLEVGAGHGLFALEALKKGNFKEYDIVDISETSIKLTQNMLSSEFRSSIVKYMCDDFLSLDAERKYDVITIGEVLEHVENPLAFIEQCKEIINPGGNVYISTCINSPEPDHIFLFKDTVEIENLFNKTGFEIENKIYLPYEHYTLAQCKAERLSINVAYVLRPI